MALKPYKVDLKRMRTPMNQYRTRGLVKGAGGNEMTPDYIFTFDDYDNEAEGLYSLKRLYLKFDDTTEYEQAMHILGSTTHWEKFVNSDFIKQHIEEYRAELKARTRSKALKQLLESAENSPSDAVRHQAQKFLVKEGFRLMDGEEAVRPKRGRPSKDEIEGNLKAMSAEEKRVMDDYNRTLQIVQ